ncbi:MAG: purine-binding chemotaxis protein CheW [Deltaproteobacteria bacterium]|nr:purine-binding chemotaxis protein CheW [Deltaproteobacteria bacterium]
MEKVRSKYAHPDFQFIRFKLADREFGIDIKNVREVVRTRAIEPVQGSPEFIEGFVVLRELRVPVIDLRKRFGFDAKAAQTLIIVSVSSRIAGLAVDSVMDVETGYGEASLMRPGQGQNPWDYCLFAVVETGGKSIHIINPSGILTPSEAAAFSRAG